jgi:flagellar motor switch protein FliN/FliY
MTTDTTPVPSPIDALISRPSDLWSRKPARIRDVQLEISAQIGRTRLPIRTVLELAVGQVIELDRQVGDAIDIIANNDVVIARGEVVEIDEEYGVRITEVIQGALD